MSRPASNNRDRLYELLADRALQGLSREEYRQLEELLALHPDVREDEIDRAVAIVDVAMAQRAAEQIPASLRDRLQAMV